MTTLAARCCEASAGGFQRLGWSSSTHCSGSGCSARSVATIKGLICGAMHDAGSTGSGSRCLRIARAGAGGRCSGSGCLSLSFFCARYSTRCDCTVVVYCSQANGFRCRVMNSLLLATHAAQSISNQSAEPLAHITSSSCSKCPSFPHRARQ